MAVTKIWRVRGRASAVIDYVSNPEKTIATLPDDELSDIADLLEYVDDVVKTEAHYYTSGINCDKDRAEEEFRLVKTQFGKPGGLVAIHGYQSFEEEDISPEKAHAIGLELARNLWGNRFQVLVATHLNTEHVHNHFVINTVSFVDGMKFHMCTDRYLEMRKESDRLCREHALSVIEHPKGKGKSHYAQMMDKAGMPTRYSVARESIDAALSVSVNMEEFKGELGRMGYKFQFNPKRKYWSVTIPGWSKPIRLYQLGKDYTNERIMERLYENDDSVRERRHLPNAYRLPKRIDKINHRKTGLERMYLRCCYEMGYLPKRTQRPAKVHKVFKEELLQCDRYSKQAHLLGNNGITTERELKAYMQKLADGMHTVEAERAKLRLFIKRTVPEETRGEAKSQITDLTAKLKKLRAERKLCEDILDRSGLLEEKLKAVDIERQRRKEVRKL